MPKFSKFKSEKRKTREKSSQWDILQNEHLINSIRLGCSLQEPEEAKLVFLLLSKRINLHFPLECRARILAHALLFIAARPRGASQGNHTGARLGLTSWHMWFLSTQLVMPKGLNMERACSLHLDSKNKHKSSK